MHLFAFHLGFNEKDVNGENLQLSTDDINVCLGDGEANQGLDDLLLLSGFGFLLSLNNNLSF